ncbi:LacI family DNA-binding transcriptional regulator [Planctomonas sp. JC2975]|uniref:LacI family DNA-binding transcriptional regulator n=1 Tax=Planctomonas sp. JC2975 TaxID=2729626 RepID=UPI001474C684|nr:LacI family DNA-binding transcriptional regulator [Planctomonas sp. JC2975]NNC12945.1 LacI family DNA-binding transcriptional regulator [Planctomonas sp. JC2975]
MRVTLKDIADEAGVSVMTVSNVVNGNRARVSQATIERVQEIVERRGYVPSASARSLAANASRMIGLLVPAADEDSLMVSPHNAAMFGLLERRLRRAGYHLLLRGVARPSEVLEAVRSWNLDGVILLGFVDADVDSFVMDGGPPLLALDSYSANPLTAGVRSDDFEGGVIAASHLLGLGHREILFAGPEFADSGVVQQRHAGFLAAHDAAGVSWDPSRLVPADTTYEAGVELGRRVRKEHPRATAVFATADILAAGVLEGLRSSGAAVPGDVSVVGFDDIDLAGYVTPKLTTIAQDVVAKSDEAVRRILDEIDGTPPDAAAVLPVRLVLRESTGAPAPG